MVEELENTFIEDVSDKEDLNREKSHRKKPIVIIAILTLIVSAILGAKYFIHSMSYVSTDDAFIEGHIIQISPKVNGIVKRIHFKDNQRVNKGDLLIEIDARDYQTALDQAKAKLLVAKAKLKGAGANVDLTAKTSNAAMVQAGSGIDFAKMGAEVAESQIAIAESGLKQAENQIIQSNAAVEKVKSNVNAVNAELNLAQKDLQRYKKLYDQGAISKQVLDNAVTKQKTLKAKLDASLKDVIVAEAQVSSAYENKNAALRTYSQAKSQYLQSESAISQATGKFEEASVSPQRIEISKSQLETVNAEIKQLEAAVSQAELNSEYTKIYAAESGYVSKRSVEEGSFVNVGQPMLAIVPDKVWVVANFKETQLTNMKSGQPVNIKVDTYPNKVFKGHVDSIQYGTGSKFSLFPPENAVGSYVKVVQRVPVKIVFDEKIDSRYVLVPGMSIVPDVKVK